MGLEEVVLIAKIAGFPGKILSAESEFVTKKTARFFNEPGRFLRKRKDF